MRAAIATGAVAVLALGACGGAGTDQAAPAVERPEYIASAGASDWYFADLPTMVATADVVVSGTVQSIEQGRETGTEEAGSEAVDSRPKMRLRAVSLKVDGVFKGAVKPGDSIVLEEFGYDRSGAPFEIEDLPWSEIGDTGIFFLYHAPDQPDLTYFQVNADGRLLFEGDKVVSFADTPLGEELSRLAVKDARAAVDSAATDAELRDIPPQERFSVQERETVERDENPRERDAPPREPGPPTPEAGG